MKFVLHDTVAYGIYNGISRFDIEQMLTDLAKEYGLEYGDYSGERIAKTLSDDAELKAIADQTYKPYPPSKDWSKEYREHWEELVDKRLAVGYGEVPEDIIEQKIRAIFAQIVRDVVEPRMEKQRQEEEMRKEILSHVVSVETKEHKIQDEGGWTKEYEHTVLMPSGRKYVFTDRNVFDFGRVISYKGMFLSRHDGKVFWNKLSDRGGWEEEEVAEDDEAVIAYRAAALFGFYGGTIRM